ncbi:MAG: cell division protein FtsQ/DivIB [Giesbergeria sp.]|nr:cell division protein FtsQ/DivIB [Giesbergeria sp.]
MNSGMPAPLDVKFMNLAASLVFVACVVLVLAAGAWWVLRHPAFAIGRIVVQGELVHNNAVTLRANVAPQLVGNFFTINLTAARDAFEQVPWVRNAQVHRQYPRTLRVVLEEHHAAAHWGPEAGSAMVNQQGEVFEANSEATEQDSLPRLQGPEGYAAQVLKMHALLQPLFGPLGMKMEALTLSGRGGWHATFEGGAVVELGGGSNEAVVQRSQRFIRTLTQVAAQHRRRPDALESADLRHIGGYAVRLRGVSTVATDDATAARK